MAGERKLLEEEEWDESRRDSRNRRAIAAAAASAVASRLAFLSPPLSASPSRARSRSLSSGERREKGEGRREMGACVPLFRREG